MLLRQLFSKCVECQSKKELAENRKKGISTRQKGRSKSRAGPEAKVRCWRNSNEQIMCFHILASDMGYCNVDRVNPQGLKSRNELGRNLHQESF